MDSNKYYPDKNKNNKNSIRYLLIDAKSPENMLSQYISSLHVEFDNISSKTREKHKLIIDKIKEEIKNPSTDWMSAYKIEQYLSYICNNEETDRKIKLGIIKIKKHFGDEKSKFYHDEFENIKNNNSENSLKEKRSLLISMQKELHYFYIKRSEYREYGVITRTRVSYLFFASMALFILSFFLYSSVEKIPMLLKVIILVLASGFLGACFSMLISLKNRIETSTMENIKVFHRKCYIIKRAFIGLGAALITYFLIQSGLLNHIVSEALLPKIPIAGNIKSESISSLIIWCFIAGFSEMLIPSILNGVENKIHKRNT